MRSRSKGFTLIEMLIVIVVIAILALIWIPRLLNAGRKSQEAELKDNLHQLRDAISAFEADCGDYPLALNDLMTKPATGTKGGGGLDLEVAAWQGPYLRTADGKLPVDPFTAVADWVYTPAAGDVHSASELRSPLSGEIYSDW